MGEGKGRRNPTRLTSDKDSHVKTLQDSGFH